ncbi:hypothetical protein Tco_0255229 [Tanacetum coccineum]
MSLRIRSTATPRGGMTGRRTGGDRGSGANGGIDEVPDFSTFIAQQLQNLLPTIIVQVGSHNSNIQGDVRNVSVNNGRGGYSYKEFLACNPKDYDGKRLARLVPNLDTLENKRIKRNGSLKKNTEKRGNGGEPSRDGNAKDDNKRSRTRRAFASTTNPIWKEVGPRMVNPLNAKNPRATRGACYECGGTDH